MARRRRLADVLRAPTRRRGRSALDRRREPDAEHLPALHADRPGQGRRAHAGLPAAPAGVPCGDFAVNTIQPTYQPYAPGTADARRLPPQNGATIGDRLSAKRSTGPGTRAAGRTRPATSARPAGRNGSGPACSDPNALPPRSYPNCPDKLFQFHHQPLNYYKTFAPGTSERARHLRDEAEFIAAGEGFGHPLPAQARQPHQADRRRERAPGLRERAHGQRPPRHAAAGDRRARAARRTRWSSSPTTSSAASGTTSPPPGFGTDGPSDVMGPSTRIPALILARGLKARLRRRPHLARHDLDHGHDRAPLRAGADHVARPPRQRPVVGVQRTSAEVAGLG